MASLRDESSALKAEGNKLKASRELGMLSELYGNTSFKWFFEEFIDKPYFASFDAFRSPHTKDEDLPKARAKYNALREIKDAILTREIVGRKRLSENDPTVITLTEKQRAL